jgi:hypothetical protein
MSGIKKTFFDVENALICDLPPPLPEKIYVGKVVLIASPFDSDFEGYNLG